MEILSGDDYRSMMEMLALLRPIGNREELARQVLPVLANLVGSDITSYNEVNPVTGTVTGLIHPDEYDVAKLAQLLERHMEDHPVITHHRRTGDVSALRISDFMSQRELHDTGLYQELYRGLGVEYQVSMIIPARKPIIAALVFNRRHSDFSARHQTLLNVLRPHLTQAFEAACTLHRLRKELARHHGILEHLPDGVALLNGNSRVEMWTNKARLWMGKYFSGPARGAYVLPEEMVLWLRRQAAADETIAFDESSPVLTRQRGEDRLIVRMVRISKTSRLLVMHEVRPTTSAKPLEEMGLSARQAQTLLYVAQGLGDKQIGGKLGISTRTVQKHLEVVFKILNVSSRTAACYKVWERLWILLMVGLLLGLGVMDGAASIY